MQTQGQAGRCNKKAGFDAKLSQSPTGKQKQQAEESPSKRISREIQN